MCRFGCQHIFCVIPSTHHMENMMLQSESNTQLWLCWCHDVIIEPHINTNTVGFCYCCVKMWKWLQGAFINQDHCKCPRNTNTHIHTLMHMHKHCKFKSLSISTHRYLSIRFRLPPPPCKNKHTQTHRFIVGPFSIQGCKQWPVLCLLISTLSP